MRIHIKFDIGVHFLMGHVLTAANAAGIKMGRYWTKDGLLIVELKEKVKLKVKIRPISYRDTYFAIEIKSAVVDGWLKVGGNAVGLVMNLCKKMIRQESPFAIIKNVGNVIYFENILSHSIGIADNSVSGELFYFADQT